MGTQLPRPPLATDPGGTEGWAPSRPEDRRQRDALALGGGMAGAGGEGSPQGPLPRLWQWPPTNPNGGSPGAGRKDRWKRRGWAREGRREEGENGGKKGREERAKEQMEGKEGGKKERKVKMGRRGNRQSRGRGKPAQERAPAPSPSRDAQGGPLGARTGWRQGSQPSGEVGEGRAWWGGGGHPFPPPPSLGPALDEARVWSP